MQPLPWVLEQPHDLLFSAARLRHVAVFPPRRLRKRHQDRLDAATRFQSEHCAAVIHHVELHIPASDTTS